MQAKLRQIQLPALTPTQASKRIKLEFPRPRAGNRRHATREEGLAGDGWKNCKPKNRKSENRKLWPRPCACLSGQLQIYNTIFHVAATNLCGILPASMPPPPHHHPWAASTLWAADVGPQHHLRHVSGFRVVVPACRILSIQCASFIFSFFFFLPDCVCGAEWGVEGHRVGITLCDIGHCELKWQWVNAEPNASAPPPTKRLKHKLQLSHKIISGSVVLLPSNEQIVCFPQAPPLCPRSALV